MNWLWPAMSFQRQPVMNTQLLVRREYDDPSGHVYLKQRVYIIIGCFTMFILSRHHDPLEILWPKDFPLCWVTTLLSRVETQQCHVNICQPFVPSAAVVLLNSLLVDFSHSSNDKRSAGRYSNATVQILHSITLGFVQTRTAGSWSCRNH